MQTPEAAMNPAAAAAVLGLTAITAQKAPPPGPPQFPGGMRLIRLDVSVVDGKGRPVVGLRSDDFVVKEEGRGVEVSYFQAIEDTPLPPHGDALSASSATTPSVNRILLLV